MVVNKLLLWLTPSPFTRPTAQEPAASSNKIAILDGLRGIACLIVLHEHWTCAIDDPWRTYALKDLATGFMWKPFVVLSWGGEAMVNLFFVISGYVLLYKPLSLLYSSEHQRMYESIASSVFRRAFRLWLPTMASILLIAVLTRMQVFEPARHIYRSLNKAQLRSFEATANVTRILEQGLVSERPKPRLVREIPPPMANSTIEQGLDVIMECFLLIKTSAVGEVGKHDVWTYDAHVWTIPVEFKSSITIFILAIGTSMFTSGWRHLLHGTVLLYCSLQGYRTALFVAGMIVAELDIMRKRSERMANRRHQVALLGEKSLSTDTSTLSEQLNGTSAAWGFCFVVGLYLLSIPYVEPVTVVPYVYLARLLPTFVLDKNKLIRSVGAVLTTWSCLNFSMVAPIFESSIAQYLGRISFALYLTHGLVIRSLGYVLIWNLRSWCGAYVREETSLGQFVLIWLGGYIVLLPSCLWTADIFWRTVDVPSVQLARWLEQRLRRPQEDKPSNLSTDPIRVCSE
ncbi:hypothetical protein H2200_009202 [Cladophialophora chaetospira]|uniref:Acyltransferase 3 domain-containing protein n=1 Tax=Cladophialophora chaetospira TaxID=386627 RepID=A0AA38X3V8_9EURO|nr:hypothetical protein H2200_009202 [Cladophialophora chaetospira]